MINPWQLLNVHRQSTDEEIRKAFISLVRNTHPDISKNEGTVETFVKLKQAYEAIRNKKARTATLKILYNKSPCQKCSGKGVSFKSKRFSSKVYTSCPSCGGSGLIL